MSVARMGESLSGRAGRDEAPGPFCVLMEKLLTRAGSRMECTTKATLSFGGLMVISGANAKANTRGRR